MNKVLFSFLLYLIACSVHAQEEIKMNREDGVYTIPCEVNGLRLRFIFDTGASEVCLSLTEASFMLKNGYLSNDDFIGVSKSQIASGQIVEDYIVNLKQVKVGSKILKNVLARIDKGLSAPLLLGQSVLSQLGEWSVRDTYLVLKDRSGNDFSQYTELDWKRRIEETENNGGKWDESIRYLMPGVLADDYNTIIAVGRMLGYAHNIDIKIDLKDEAAIVEKLKRLANSNDKTAIFELACYYEASALNLNDIDKARDLYEKLIDGKTLYLSSSYDSPYIKLYNIYTKHYAQPQKAIEYLQKGALLNESTCIDYLFESYDDRKEFQELFQWAEKLSKNCTGASKGKAIYWKAKCLLEGIGVDKDTIQGVQLLEQLIIKDNLGNDEAIKELCDYYLIKGKYNQCYECAQRIVFQKFYRHYYLGCSSYFIKDYSSARLNLRQLLDKDRGICKLNELGFGICLLGDCYENGLGGAINYKNAEKCYKYATDNCNYVGAYRYYGDFLSNNKIYQEPNYELAFDYYMQGANNDDAYCCYMVSQFYKNGIGTLKDSKVSKYWLQKAKDNGWKK